MQPAQPFKSLRRLSCGCLMVVVLLIVLMGCAVGFGLSHLWVRSASAAGVLRGGEWAKGVRLSDVVSEAASDGRGEFVVNEVMFEYERGEVWLSGTPDGRGELETDDKAMLVVRHPDGSEARWEHEFASADGEEVLPLAAVEISALFEVGVNEVTLRLEDLRPFAYSSTGYYLVAREGSEGVRATRVKYKPIQTVTATVPRATVVATPTVAPNPTVVPSPMAVPSPTAVPSPMVPLVTAVPNPTAVASPTVVGTATAVASPTVVASPTAVVSPTATVSAVGQGTAGSSDGKGELVPFGAAAALLLLVGGLVWGRRKKEVPVVLGGWLDGCDHETGEVLPLVSLSGYGRKAAILREPLRLVTLDESVGEDEDEDKVVTRLFAGDDGIGRVAYGEDEEWMELGHEKRLEIGSLVLEYRNPLARK